MELWKGIKKGFRLIWDMKGEWSRTAQREIMHERMEVEGKFHAERLQFMHLQQQERIIAQAIEYEKNRENSYTIADLQRNLTSMEGILNREMQEKIMKLNHENLAHLEQARHELVRWQISKQREIHHELKAIDNKLVWELKAHDRKVALENFKEQRRLNNLPIVLNLDEILTKNEKDQSIINVFFSPPNIRYDKVGERYDKSFPLSEERFTKELRTFFDIYNKNNRKINFVGGAWQTKGYHSESAVKAIYSEMKTENTIILEALVEEEFYNINLSYWGANWSGYNFKNVISISWKEILYDIVKNRTIIWRNKQEVEKISDEDYINIIGNETFEGYKKNCEIIEREEKASFNGFDVKSVDRNYVILQIDTNQLINFLSVLQSIFYGLIIDEFYLIHLNTKEQHLPLLPFIWRDIVSGLTSAEIDSLIHILSQYYKSLYHILIKEEPYDSPKLKLELSTIFFNLSLDKLAQKELTDSLNILLDRGIYSKKTGDIESKINFLNSVLTIDDKDYVDNLYKIITQNNLPEFINIKSKIKKIMESYRTDTDNHIFSDSLKRIKELFAEAINIVDSITINQSELNQKGPKSILQNLLFWQEKCNNQKFQIAVLALAKSGKSTFLNALIGNEFLPMSNVPETALAISIEHTPNSEGLLKDNSNEVAKGSIDILSYITQLNDSIRNKKIKAEDKNLKMYTIVNAFSGKVMDGINFEIIDTPGFGEAAKEIVNTKSYDESNEELIGNLSVIIYILDFTKLKTNTEKEIITKLLSLRNDILKSIHEKLFFVVNKVDIRDRNSLSPEETINYVYNLLSAHFPYFRKEQIITVSSSRALLAKLVLDNKASEDAKKDFLKLAFGEENYEGHDEADVIKAAKNTLAKSNIETVEKNILGFIYDNRSGLFIKDLLDNLERILLDFKNKFIITAEGTLKSTVVEIEKLELKIIDAKKKQDLIESEAEKFQNFIKDFVNQKFSEFKNQTQKNINEVFDFNSNLADDNSNWSKWVYNAKKAIKKLFGSIFSYSSTSKEEVINKIKELNITIFNELKENFEFFRNDLEKEVLIKQKDLFHSLEDTINTLARVFEQIINKSLNVKINSIELKLKVTSIDQIQEDVNNTLEKFINRRNQTQTVKQPKKVWNNGSWCGSGYYTFEEEWVKVSSTHYEVSKDIIQMFWLKSIEEMQQSAQNLTNHFVENQIKLEIKKAKTSFNNYVDDYLSIIKSEKEKIGNPKDILTRQEELKGLKERIEIINDRIHEIYNLYKHIPNPNENNTPSSQSS